MSHLQTVELHSIRVRNRIRQDLGDLEPLRESMRRSGLLNPITITANFYLVAGQRRLESARQLGWKRIQCYVVDTDDPEALLRLELDENTERKDFTSDEMADALLRLDTLQNPPWHRRMWRWIRSIFRRLGSIFRFKKGTEKK